MCGKALTKILLIVFNVIFVILGLAVFVVGLWARFDDDSFAALFAKIPSSLTEGEKGMVDIPGLISSASVVLIIGGAFILIVGFLGCCGAWKEISCFLIVYSLVLAVLIIVEIAFVVAMQIAQDKIEDHLNKFLIVTIAKGYIGGSDYHNGEFRLTSDATTLAWDMTQLKLRCCGAVSYKDYNQADKWDHKVHIPAEGDKTEAVTAKVPLSCCKIPDDSSLNEMATTKSKQIKQCLENPTNATANLGGCYEKVKGELMGYSMIAGGVAVAIAVMELCGLLCACWLFKSLRKESGYEKTA